MKRPANLVQCTGFRTLPAVRRWWSMRTIDTARGRRKIEASSAVEEADVVLAARLAGNKDHPVVRALGALSEVGDQAPLVAVSGAVLAYGVLRGDRHAAAAGARMMGSLILATWIKTGLKHLVARTRPNVLLEEGRYEVQPLGPDEGSWQSFPSGHTAGSVAVARAVGRIYPQARTAAYGGAAAIALVQIPRGAHYPMDLAAGALVGLAAEAAVDMVANHLGAATSTQDDRS
jgi:membrane-associated phospholipid phosphatase